MDKVRLGFVGVGGMGQCAHLRNYVTLPECEVVALAELRPELGRKVGARYGIPHVYTDYREMLAQQELDGLVAIQPFTLHGQLIPELLQAGIPVITEKPLARSVEAGQKVLNASRKQNTPLYIAYHKRSDPATMFAKQKIEEWKQSGIFGAMRYIRLTMPPGKWDAAGFSHLLGSSDPYPSVSHDPTPSGMDAETALKLDSFVNYYIHQVNLMRHLLGEGYQVVFADPTQVLLVTRSDSGITGTLEMAPYQTSIDWQESALIGFEKGWIRLELPAPMVIDQPGRVTVYEDAGQGNVPQTSSPTLPYVHAMRQQALNFVKAIQGEATPLCGPDDALTDLQVAEQYIALLAQA